MDLTLNADQKDLRAALRDRLADLWTPDRLRAASETSSFDRDAWKALAETGVFAITLPEADGGMGLGTADAVILFEELGRAQVPGPVTGTFLAAGLVPGAAEGDAVVTLLDTRDAMSVIEHPGAATHLVVIDDDGLFLLPVPRAEPAALPLDPLTPVARVSVRAEDGERIGSAEDAARWRLLGAVLTASLQVGAAQGALDLAVRYAKERMQFDRVIGSFQAVKHLLAESLVRTDLARAAVLVAALVADDPASGDLREAASTAKLLADEAAAHGGRTGIQVHGGMGFTWEVLAHLYLKRAWVQETVFGTAGDHAEHLAAAF
ncbi:acyl-CoA dehydrogenase family protein [Actinocorallia populi]|uniref:acyl-CoA dehydrogenase family protein n=1 Tax=Actinocorallia populi TaxID=2079200 RepID=UPI000D08E03F|nr:acyl-CoA dehydrogenase family protein [Actinocorallia populi]